MARYYKGSPPSMVSFIDILMDSTRLIIPVYQRNYTWKTKNVEKLLNDLNKLKPLEVMMIMF